LLSQGTPKEKVIGMFLIFPWVNFGAKVGNVPERIETVKRIFENLFRSGINGNFYIFAARFLRMW